MNDCFLQVKSSEQELRQTSLLVVPLFLALVLVYWRRDEILARLARAAPRPAKPSGRARPDVPDLANIDQLVSSVNAAGKKKKQ